MAPAAPSFAAAAMQHLMLLLTFRHDGRGLPATLSPVAWASLVLYGLVGALVVLTGAGVEREAPWLSYASNLAWVIGAAVFLAGPLKYVEALVGLVLVNVLFDGALLVGRFLVSLSGEQGHAPPLLQVLVGGWALAAQISLLYRHYLRLSAASPKN